MQNSNSLFNRPICTCLNACVCVLIHFLFSNWTHGCLCFTAISVTVLNLVNFWILTRAWRDLIFLREIVARYWSLKNCVVFCYAISLTDGGLVLHWFDIVLRAYGCGRECVWMNAASSFVWLWNCVLCTHVWDCRVHTACYGNVIVLCDTANIHTYTYTQWRWRMLSNRLLSFSFFFNIGFLLSW